MRSGTRLAMLACTMLALPTLTDEVMAQAPGPSVVGTWTGTVAQNSGATRYTVVMTVTATGGQTDYPELHCGGKLTRMASANGYVFFTETITRGGKSSGGSCIDGTLTIAPAGAGLSWGWMGPMAARSTWPGATWRENDGEAAVPLWAFRRSKAWSSWLPNGSMRISRAKCPGIGLALS